jgi:hypothetical protein
VAWHQPHPAGQFERWADPIFVLELPHGNYAAAQAIAIRRQADNGRKVRSLWRLLDELASDPDFLSRETYVGLLDEFQAEDDLLVQRAHEDWDRWSDTAGRRFNGRVARDDQQELERTTHRVKDYVDQHVAHDQRNPTAEIPTFETLHQAIDAIGAMFQKYAAILTGAYWGSWPHDSGRLEGSLPPSMDRMSLLPGRTRSWFRAQAECL